MISQDPKTRRRTGVLTQIRVTVSPSFYQFLQALDLVIRGPSFVSFYHITHSCPSNPGQTHRTLDFLLHTCPCRPLPCLASWKCPLHFQSCFFKFFMSPSAPTVSSVVSFAWRCLIYSNAFLASRGSLLTKF